MEYFSGMFVYRKFIRDACTLADVLFGDLFKNNFFSASLAQKDLNCTCPVEVGSELVVRVVHLHQRDVDVHPEAGRHILTHFK